MISRFLKAAVVVGLAASSACAIEYDESRSDYPASRAGVDALIADRCSNCHGYAPGEGGLELPADLDRIVVAGSPEQSVLWQRLDRGEMPPADNPAPAESVEHVREWIAAGAVGL